MGPGRDRGKGIAAYEAILQRGDTTSGVLINLGEALRSRREFARTESLNVAANRISAKSGTAYGNAIEMQINQRKVREAATFTSERARHHDRGLAVIGFSLGAYYALDVSTTDTEDVRRVVIFYGTGGGDFFRSKAAYLGHFAENDPYESAADVAALEGALKSAKRPVTFHHYPGTGHWFFEPDRPQAYNETAAQLAWERTLAFLLRVAPRAS